MLKTNQLYNENCLGTLKRMPADYVDCVVTSPPYWGLRDYGIEPSIWDAQGGCLHEWGDEVIPKQKSNWDTFEKYRTDGGVGKRDIGMDVKQGQFCTKCSAWLGNLGLEPTPELYVQHMVTIFQEIKRALKPEGTVWLNLGDSYASASACDRRNVIGNSSPDAKCHRPNRLIGGLKEKDLIGIPWRVAFALQANGWYLRSDIIWHKPNPMPESVTDRPTKSHEYIFLLSKQAKYYYDADAIREPYSLKSYERNKYLKAKSTSPGRHKPNNKDNRHKESHIQLLNPKGANRRSVWSIATKPFKEAHFATFPPDLILPCILAGCPKDGIVYDPFMGSGTTAEVARFNNRKYIGSELNPDYIKLLEKRLGLFSHAPDD